jgi:hypothetical protein
MSELSLKVEQGNLQATLVKSCLAKFWIWLFGNGTNWLPFRKSKTLCPSRSMTMHIWPRKSKQSRRCIHLFRFSWSFALSVERTRSSIREASRYFWTDLMILTATSLSRLLSRALTTLPNVPCPRSDSISSALLSAPSRRIQEM